MYLKLHLFIIFMFVVDITGVAKSFDNIEYGTAGGYSLRMDARIPEGTGPFPAAIIVHGGAWVTGDRRRSVEPLFGPLAAADFAWFSIDYRLADVDPGSIATTGLAALTGIGAAADDVRTAVAYIRNHASEYRIDPHRIALIGESAGAQLASMAALKSPPEEGVQAVVAFYGPSDLVSLIQTNRQIPDYIRQTLNGSPLGTLLLTAMRNLSPVNWVRKDSPPFLLIHGTADRLVPFEQSVAMRDALQRAGVSSELYPVDGGGHGVRWWEAQPSLTAYKRAMIRWLKEKLAP